MKIIRAFSESICSFVVHGWKGVVLFDTTIMHVKNPCRWAIAYQVDRCSSHPRRRLDSLWSLHLNCFVSPWYFARWSLVTVLQNWRRMLIYYSRRWKPFLRPVGAGNSASNALGGVPLACWGPSRLRLPWSTSAWVANRMGKSLLFFPLSDVHELVSFRVPEEWVLVICISSIRWTNSIRGWP